MLLAVAESLPVNSPVANVGLTVSSPLQREEIGERSDAKPNYTYTDLITLALKVMINIIQFRSYSIVSGLYIPNHKTFYILGLAKP